MTKRQDFQAWIETTAAATQSEPVPEWPRETTFQSRTASAQAAWWQRPWLPLASLAYQL